MDTDLNLLHFLRPRREYLLRHYLQPSEQLTPADTSGCGYSSGSRTAEQVWPTPVVRRSTTSSPAAPLAVGTQGQPGVAFGKRRRETEAGPDDGDLAAVGCYGTASHKRVKGSASSGVLAAAQSRGRGSRNAANKTPRGNNRIPKAEGCTVEKPATPSAQGMSNHPSLGSGFQQGWTAGSVQEGVPRIPGVVEGGSWQLNDSVAQHGEGIYDTENDQLGDPGQDSLFQIPKDINNWRRALLMATEDDWKRGTVPQLACRVCPNSVFKNWTVFNKHADTAEAHPSPSEVRYCDRCGDPFGRGDAFARHCKEPPRECVNISPEKAQEKRAVTEREHKAFVERVERCQETGEDIGKTFAEIIKEKYPDSCKKRIRQGRGQSRRSKT